MSTPGLTSVLLSAMHGTLNDTGYAPTPRTLSAPLRSRLTELGKTMRAEQLRDDDEMECLHIRSDEIVDRMLSREGFLRILRDLLQPRGSP